MPSPRFRIYFQRHINSASCASYSSSSLVHVVLTAFARFSNFFPCLSLLLIDFIWFQGKQSLAPHSLLFRVLPSPSAKCMSPPRSHHTTSFPPPLTIHTLFRAPSASSFAVCTVHRNDPCYFCTPFGSSSFGISNANTHTQAANETNFSSEASFAFHRDIVIFAPYRLIRHHHHRSVIDRLLPSLSRTGRSRFHLIIMQSHTCSRSAPV